MEHREREWLKRLPVCSECGKKIRDEQLYVINDEYYCEECVDGFRDYTENHMEG